MLRTDRQGRRKSEPLSSRRSKNKPDTVRLFLAWQTAARDAPEPAKGGNGVFSSLRRKEHHSPFWKRQKVFVLFLYGKKKNPRAIAKIESLYPRLSRTAPRTQSALPVNRRARTVVRAFSASAGNGPRTGSLGKSSGSFLFTEKRTDMLQFSRKSAKV